MKNTLYAQIYTAKGKPLMIDTIVNCIKKRSEVEPNYRLPHKLKIQTITNAPRKIFCKI